MAYVALDHQNAYVRHSVAKSLAVAVDQWPQSIGAVVETLQSFYRDKAKILAPEFDQYVSQFYNCLLA
jgi:hypothetical protein